MDPNVWVGIAGVLIVPAGLAGYRFVQKVNKHDILMEEFRNGLDRIETKVDTLTEVILQRAIGERARERRGEKD